MTRYFIAGATGMLGSDLKDALAGREITALGHADLDITDADAVRSAVAGHDVVINAAAYTRVDDAEADEDTAYSVNATGAAHLAEAAAKTGARIVQLSTDYVFDGAATRPYREDTAHAPISAYGRTKSAGEKLVQAAHPQGAFIVRTAWLYGAHGGNFAATMLRLADSTETWSVVADQVGQPTWSMDLAERIVELLDREAPAGAYHITNSGQTTWFEFARKVLSTAGLDPERITPTTSDAFPRPAPRPAYSVLDHGAWDRAGLSPLRPWQAALDDAFAKGVFSR